MYKLTENGYVLAVSATAADGVEITEQEYNAILTALKNKPLPQNGKRLMLTEKLEWVFVDAQPDPVSDEEALTCYANELTGADDPDLISAAETLLTERIKEES